MSKEKLISLTKYVDSCKNRLEDKMVPEKHKNRESTYRQFLANEIKTATVTIEALKLSGAETKK